MKNSKLTILSVVVAFFLIVGGTSVYILNEGRQAIITQFGRPVGEPITNAGLHFKLPFIQKVRYVDKRILSWDGVPNQIPTKDKKYISVDTTARWKIIDVLKFIQTVQNEEGAKARLDTILESSTRNVISNHNLVEVVRNSNTILEIIKGKREKFQQKVVKDETSIDEEVVGEIENVEVGREALSTMIVKSADSELTKFGIELVDVQLKRISYEKSVEKKVYERMISERQRIAQKIRSVGQGEKAKIEGRLTKDLKNIESKAYRRAQEIRGEAEAKSIAIYAAALRSDPAFYEFLRSMEAYERSFPEGTKFLLSSDSEFLKFLKQMK